MAGCARPSLGPNRLFPNPAIERKGDIMSHIDRRKFLQLTGMAAITSSLNTNIAKALAIPANNRTGAIREVEHIVVLLQDNRALGHRFGTHRDVPGLSVPRAVDLHPPLPRGGPAPASV